MSARAISRMLVAVFSGVSGTACAGPDGDGAECTCVDTTRVAIVVEVRDSLTGEPAAAGGVLAIQEGQFVDSAVGATSTDSPPYPMIFRMLQRPGTYDVSVRRAGYQTWTQRAVRVERQDCCSVWTAELVARLAPLP